MRREWSPEDVVACWTPVGSDWDLVANKGIAEIRVKGAMS